MLSIRSSEECIRCDDDDDEGEKRGEFELKCNLASSGCMSNEITIIWDKDRMAKMNFEDRFSL